MQLDGNCSQMQAIIDKFETKGIFSKLGLLKDYSCKVKIDNSVKVISSPPARLGGDSPIVLGEVEDKLKELCSEGIICKIEEPTDCCSRIVIAKRKNGEIRISTDLHSLNKALKHSIFQMPDPSDILPG